MATVIPEGFANVRYIFQCDGVIDTMGFSIGCAVGLGETGAVIASETGLAFANTVWGDGASAADTYTFVGTAVTVMTVTGPVVSEFTLNEEGTAVFNVPPSNLSLLIRKNTASGGRKNRGRIFMPTAVVSEADVNQAGVITSFAQGVYQGQWTDFYDALVTDGNEPVLFHSDPADAPTPITAFSVQGVAATQRRRMR